jgi:predicted AlkP superfamily phosphohydrolase/phosphomutase
MSSKAVLIGLDGATFSILDPLMDRGVMPYLKGLIAKGVRAPLNSVIPPLTPPAWTSLMTGLRPGRHGVFDFFQKESPDSRYFRFAAASDIQSETIWSLASAHGRRVTALNFPLMFPPPQVNGSVVPGGWMPWKQLRLGCHPAGLFDRLKLLPSFHAKELALDMMLEEKTLEGCSDDELPDWIELHCRRERRWCDILAYLMEHEPADLTAILFDGVDKLQHLCWRFLDPACQSPTPTPQEQQIRDLCEGYFRQLDGLIAEIVERAGPDATIVMASDHGFGPTWDVFYANTWLEQEGFLAWADARPTEDAQGGPKVGIGQITRHVFEMDWEKTIAYAATPSSQGIHIVRQTVETPHGVPPEAYDRVREQIITRLTQLRHPETGRPVVSDVYRREDAYAGPHQAFGPDITFFLEDNGVISILRSKSPFRRRSAPAGTHHPEGTLIAYGPSVKAGAALPALSLVDVAPLLLYGLDVPVPADLDGRLPTDVFEPSALSARPPVYSESTREAPRDELVAASATVDPGYDEAEENMILQRLRALGYVE